MNKIINHLRFSFASTLQIQAKNIFNDQTISTYTSLDDSALQSFIETSHFHHRNWLKLPQTQKQNIITQFKQQLKDPSNIATLSYLLTYLTGKELSECLSEVNLSYKIFDSHLNYNYTVKQQSSRNYYTLQPFDSIISIFDHRSPILSAFSYLGLSLRSNNALLLRPSYSVLPVVKFITDIWQTCSQIQLIRCLIDPYIDPKHDNSPVKNLLKSTQGFVNFAGRIKDGFDFHYYLMNQSQVFVQSELLLTSSDSAYIMKDLSPQQLATAASIVARGCFSNAGHNSNSIKRVFVDRQIGDQFMNLLVQKSQLYEPSQNILNKLQSTTFNDGKLAPFLLQSEFEESNLKLSDLKQKHKDEFKLITGGDNLEVKTPHRQISFIRPTIFKVQADFPHYNYQNEELLMPICFVAFVDSPSDCIEKINSSIYGITASLFTADPDIAKVEEIGRRLDVGTVNVNTWEMTDGITYSGRKRSGKGFSFSPLSFNNIVRTKAVSFYDK